MLKTLILVLFFAVSITGGIVVSSLAYAAPLVSNAAGKQDRADVVYQAVAADTKSDRLTQ